MRFLKNSSDCHLGVYINVQNQNKRICFIFGKAPPFFKKEWVLFIFLVQILETKSCEHQKKRNQNIKWLMELMKILESQAQAINTQELRKVLQLTTDAGHDTEHPAWETIAPSEPKHFCPHYSGWQSLEVTTHPQNQV